MGKITVKHYLNENELKGVKNKAHFLSPEDENFKRSVYVQVTVKRQVNRLRSHANKYAKTGIVLGMTRKAFATALVDGNSEIGKALTLERKVITDIINYLKPFDRIDFTLSNFASIYEIATDDIPTLINGLGKHLLMLTLDNQWNAVGGIINWDKPFIEIIEGLYLIGESNQAFRELVLNNDQTQAS